jgi:hypothetical protein
VRWALAALLGMILCSVCDHLHATYGVLYYPFPVLWAQAWWVPLLFFTASLSSLSGAGVVRRALRGEGVDATARQLVGSTIAFITAYVFTAFAHSQPNVVLAVLVGWWLARVVSGAPVWLVAFSLVTAVLGTCFEATLSRVGGFYYHHPDFMGVPRWLPGIYLHAALLAGPLHQVVAVRTSLPSGSILPRASDRTPG